MNRTSNLGILGIGVFLPEDIRKNEWWSREVVDNWVRQAAQHPPPPPPADDSEAEVMGAMAKLGSDPFRGAVERRIMPKGMEIADMEIAAAKAALARAGVKPSEIDLILVYSTVPDYLTTNAACTVHAALGLPTNCFALSVDAGCNAFQQQLSLAQSMLTAGQMRYGLLVQSCGLSRVLPYDKPHSAWFGDGATATVVGSVAAGRGLLGEAHRTDGTLQCTLVTGIPDGHWYDEGRPTLHSPRPDLGRLMLSRIPYYARESSAAALEDANLRPEDVGFYACHQAFPWYREATQAYAGLADARGLDTFTWAGSLSAANIPLVLATAQDEGLLRPDDLVVTHSGGSGITWSSLVLRWGC